MLIAGDTIIDWIIHKGKVTPAIGGAGNIVRGLAQRGFDVEFLTLYNPALYPLGYRVKLHPHSLTDFTHSNTFVRDYDKGVFQRFRGQLKTGVLDVYNATAVICHEDSVIRRFTSFYADVRDTSVAGECAVLRMSSSDDTDAIMKKITHGIAIITHKDKVEVKGLWVDEPDYWHTILFPEVAARDDIGAGDTFNVGFLSRINDMADGPALIEDAIRAGIAAAQEKVTEIGVYL